MKKIIINLENAKYWLNKPLPPRLSSDNDYMIYVMELMNFAHYLIKVSASIAPNQVIADRGYSKHKAIVTGHVVRLSKLYHGFAYHVSKSEVELAYIMTRLIFECITKMEYLFTAEKSSFRSFVFTSYRSQKEILHNLDLIKSERKLMKIEKSIIKKIKQSLRSDRISLSQLRANKNWKLDGKDFKQILASMKKEIDYPFLFGRASSFIHGDWSEMKIFNLEKRGRYYIPNLSFAGSDPRLALPVTIGCLNAVTDFLKWNKSDPQENVMLIIQEFSIKTKKFYDQYCEEKYADV
jgi:hypothetical protein